MIPSMRVVLNCIFAAVSQKTGTENWHKTWRGGGFTEKSTPLSGAVPCSEPGRQAVYSSIASTMGCTTASLDVSFRQLTAHEVHNACQSISPPMFKLFAAYSIQS